MKTADILTRLECLDGTFPRRALQEAIASREQITPGLLSILEHAAQNIQELVLREGDIAHIFAMYLLAQFREKRAYPLIVDFFSIPGEITLDLTGDVVTEALDRILASVSGGDTRLIKSLVENEGANEYVRTAALRALVILVARGARTREEVVEYCQSLFRGGLERRHPLVWAGLVDCCSDLYPAEVIEDTRQAFREGLVDEGFIDAEWAEEALARGKEPTLARLQDSRRYTYIDDTIRETEWWACFEAPKQPAVVEGKVGRNQPCPCGSGKKYKHCCGARH